jgi:hypothetical protein
MLEPFLSGSLKTTAWLRRARDNGEFWGAIASTSSGKTRAAMYCLGWERVVVPICPSIPAMQGMHTKPYSTRKISWISPRTGFRSTLLSRCTRTVFLCRGKALCGIPSHFQPLLPRSPPSPVSWETCGSSLIPGTMCNTKLPWRSRITIVGLCLNPHTGRLWAVGHRPENNAHCSAMLDTSPAIESLLSAGPPSTGPATRMPNVA